MGLPADENIKPVFFMGQFTEIEIPHKRLGDQGAAKAQTSGSDRNSLFAPFFAGIRKIIVSIYVDRNGSD